MGAIFGIIAISLMIASAVLGVGLFLVLLFKRKVKKDLDLFARNSKQTLDGNEAQYFSSIKHEDANGMIVFRQKESFKVCCVTLVTSNGGKRSAKRYKLSFTSEQNVAAIKLDEPVDEYRVVLESVDKKLVKHQAVDSLFPFTIIYSLVVTVVYVAAIIFYIMMCSYYLMDYWAGYALYYAFAAVGLVFPVVVIGGYLLMETLSRKGGF